MTTTKVEFVQLSKCVTAHVKIESDTLTEDEILEHTVRLALKAQGEANSMTLRMI